MPRLELGEVAVAPVHTAGDGLSVAAARWVDAPIEHVEVAAFTIPTDRPESDGTFEWEETTIVVVEVAAGDVCGLGFSYTGEADTSVAGA